MAHVLLTGPLTAEENGIFHPPPHTSRKPIQAHTEPKTHVPVLPAPSVGMLIRIHSEMEKRILNLLAEIEQKKLDLNIEEQKQTLDLQCRKMLLLDRVEMIKGKSHTLVIPVAERDKESPPILVAPLAGKSRDCSSSLAMPLAKGETTLPVEAMSFNECPIVAVCLRTRENSIWGSNCTAEFAVHYTRFPKREDVKAKVHNEKKTHNNGVFELEYSDSESESEAELAFEYYSDLESHDADEDLVKATGAEEPIGEIEMDSEALPDVCDHLVKVKHKIVKEFLTKLRKGTSEPLDVIWRSDPEWIFHPWGADRVLVPGNRVFSPDFQKPVEYLACMYWNLEIGIREQEARRAGEKQKAGGYYTNDEYHKTVRWETEDVTPDHDYGITIDGVGSANEMGRIRLMTEEERARYSSPDPVAVVSSGKKQPETGDSQEILDLNKYLITPADEDRLRSSRDPVTDIPSSRPTKTKGYPTLTVPIMAATPPDEEEEETPLSSRDYVASVWSGQVAEYRNAQETAEFDRRLEMGGLDDDEDMKLFDEFMGDEGMEDHKEVDEYDADEEFDERDCVF